MQLAGILPFRGSYPGDIKTKHLLMIIEFLHTFDPLLLREVAALSLMRAERGDARADS